MNIDPALLAILACPEDKGPLWFVGSESLLFNPRLQRSYPVIDGIPVMLIQESSAVTDTEAQRLQGIISAQGLNPTF
ncbi:MAG: Trm112 family protein [Actinobacteria bacterium]|nr:Trm112 family protein [Actinomycetota bacterium]